MIKNVLIVDDNPVDRENLKSVLEKSGYKIVMAENGKLALDAIKESKPDLVMMDVNMPEMDGFAATRELRDNEETKDIPVILVTAKDQKADRAWGTMLGAKGYIAKPFTDKDVLSALDALS